MPSEQFLASVAIDETAFPSSNANVKLDRETTITEIVGSNRFFAVAERKGPYRLNVGLADDRLLFEISGESGEFYSRITVPRASLGSLIKDYFLLCESYDEAIAQGRRARIETLDVGRRSLHNDGATVILERFGEQVETDWETARRLFTLTCLLIARRPT